MLYGTRSSGTTAPEGLRCIVTKSTDGIAKITMHWFLAGVNAFRPLTVKR
ncbi:hypothetical protein ACLBOM_14040 [Escherichia coli]